jgi:hypothetical protein
MAADYGMHNGKDRAEVKAAENIVDYQSPESSLRRRDDEQIRRLTIAHYAVGAFLALVTMLLITMAAGLLVFYLSVAKPSAGDTGDYRLLMLTLAMPFMALLAGGWTAACFAAGQCLQERQRPRLCWWAAMALLLFLPAGTVLGALTLLVLGRPTVVHMFKEKAETTAERNEPRP